ncbi:hypothetical protein Megvenef_00049 [Candidatus Megaera venefica]|uniref:Flagellin n=1 Tax=Candidatus Megaera venefica TaxID=2055910 RepID=A0ABU5NAE3_9RICK|nr:hypothetical protein [Candidatus Megaera venefica]MEA0970101.1 hypothetical protein [Candidatus Megaera venefica]
MPLTLGNDLTGLVSREVDAAGNKATGLGESLTTGNDKFVEVVDAFLGNSLRDGQIILGAVAKNTAYSINLLTITDEYLKTIARSLQGGLKTVASADPLAADKLTVLNKNLNDKRAQVNLLVDTADFDNKGLLRGDVKEMQIQVGLNAADKLRVHVNDFSLGKLFRSSVTNALNELIKLGPGLYPTNRYTTIDEVNQAASRNVNLFYGAWRTSAEAGGSGIPMVAVNGANLVFNLPLAQKEFLDQIAPVCKAWLVANAGGATFTTATAANLTAMLAVLAPVNELYNNIINDNATTDVSTQSGRLYAQDVFHNALNSVRAEQAAISNQKANVIEAADALRATTNVTQKAADSYLKTDYVLTAQQYSETIRIMVASITSLQAANKIPEAAQKLIDALAR